MQNTPYIPWSDEERDTLRRLRENGLSIRQCADMMGRSFHSVNRAVHRLRLGKPVPEPRPRPARPEPPRRVGLVSLPPLPSLRHD